MLKDFGPQRMSVTIGGRDKATGGGNAPESSLSCTRHGNEASIPCTIFDVVTRSPFEIVVLGTIYTSRLPSHATIGS